jgi:hypothetical protein
MRVSFPFPGVRAGLSVGRRVPRSVLLACVSTSILSSFSQTRSYDVCVTWTRNENVLHLRYYVIQIQIQVEIQIQIGYRYKILIVAQVDEAQAKQKFTD